MDFPFEAVYDYFSKPIVNIGLDSGLMPPMLFSVAVKDGKVVHCSELPTLKVGEFFGSSGGKALFGEFLRKAISHIGDQPYCLVLMSEAWVKMYDVKDKDKIRNHGSLEHDKDASESVMITIYRPGCTRIGTLPINKDRTLTWLPLHATTDIKGRFTTDNSEHCADHAAH